MPRTSELALGGVVAAYVGAAFVIPTLANVAVTDDWAYYRSVEELVRDGRLRIHEMSAATLIFQTWWGAGFAALFGLSFGVLRASTLVLYGLSGLAFYGLCREVGASRPAAAVGTALYLFHPVALALAYTFMTDPHFVALTVISAYLYVRGLKSERPLQRHVIAGSMVAACAFLVRQQGALIPLSLVLALLVARRLPWSVSGLRLLLSVTAFPATVAIAYFAWLRLVHGIPWAQTLFLSDISQAGAGGVLLLLPRLLVVGLGYLGFFLLPLVLPTLLLPPLWRSPRRAWAALAWTLLVVIALTTYALQGSYMPYAGQFFTTTGFGPEDLVGGRPPQLQIPLQALLTIACGLSAGGFGLALMRQADQSRSGPLRLAGLLVLALFVGQALGTLPPSVHFIPGDGTLDRYLLPLLPLGIALFAWATRDLPRALPGAWLATLAVGLYAVVGTRDHLVFVQSVWSLADEANALGVENQRLDAGAGWDGFHMHEAPPSPERPPQTPRPPWWIALYAPRVDSSYIVASRPVPGYSVVLERDYSSWLQQRRLPLYLVRRGDLEGPP